MNGRANDAPLHHEPVYARLNWVWSWRGITLGHMAVCLVPAFFFCMLAWLVQENLWPACPMGLGLLPSMGLFVFIGLMQYRRDPQHLLRQLRQMKRARHLSALRRALHVSDTTRPQVKA